MKRSIALVFIAAAALAGCSRPVKETVIERPVYVTPPATVVTPAASGATSASCIYASQAYSHGAMSCQQGREFRCNNGAWDRTEVSC